MFYPCGEVPVGKAYDSACALTKAQRVELLQHPLLDDFCFTYWGSRDEVKGFRRYVTRLASLEGYLLDYEMVAGSDHSNRCVEQGSVETFVWPTRDVVTSDVIRTSILWADEIDENGSWVRTLKRIPGCRPLIRQDGVRVGEQYVGSKCSDCMVCEKYDRTLRLDDRPSDVMKGILERCHQSDTSIYTCIRNSGGTITFIPSGLTES